MSAAVSHLVCVPVCLPTHAGGKSLTYQLPAVVSKGLTGAAQCLLPLHSFHFTSERGYNHVMTSPNHVAEPPPLSAVVVTPLLSLMQDQVQALTMLPSGGVPTTYLSSQQSVKETQASGYGAALSDVFVFPRRALPLLNRTQHRSAWIVD